MILLAVSHELNVIKKKVVKSPLSAAEGVSLHDLGILCMCMRIYFKTTSVVLQTRRRRTWNRRFETVRKRDRD